MYIKYPRTYHLPCSPGRTNDDKVLGSYDIFNGQNVVVTIKMDGECTTGYSDGYIHARSIDGRSHPSRNWVKNYLAPKLAFLPKGWRVCGENLYAKHSILYEDLESYFYVFSIWDEYNTCLNWNTTIEYCRSLALKTVPVLYSGIWDMNKIRELKKYVDDNKDKNTIEGFVVRKTCGFRYDNFKDNVAKYVRANHITTSEHWMQNSIIKNKLKT